MLNFVICLVIVAAQTAERKQTMHMLPWPVPMKLISGNAWRWAADAQAKVC